MSRHYELLCLVISICSQVRATSMLSKGVDDAGMKVAIKNPLVCGSRQAASIPQNERQVPLGAGTREDDPAWLYGSYDLRRPTDRTASARAQPD